MGAVYLFLAYISIERKKQTEHLDTPPYYKATHINLCLNALSQHHPAQKASTLNSLMHRAFSLSESGILKGKLDCFTVLQANNFHSNKSSAIDYPSWQADCPVSQTHVETRCSPGLR